MFHIVEEGHGMVNGTEQDDLAIKHQESFERRIRAESIVPRLAGDKVRSLLAPEHETRNVAIHLGIRICSQEFDQYPVVARRSCRERDEPR